MSATSNLGLPYIDAGQAQKHVTHNEALRYLDALVQLAVQDRDLTAPPSSPIEGQRWIVKTGATDAWSDHADDIAAWQDGAWQFSAPIAGWVAYVIDEEILVAWDGGSWNAVSAGGGGGDPTELQDMTLLGIGTTADTANPLSAKLNNVLWTAKTVAEGGDGTLRYKLSKESAANTLSFLLQDNFVGCAEIGLTGDDDFHFKVSPDGTAWLEAIKIDRATGKLSFPISGGPREVLSANRTYYVRTDGNDSNNGLANTSGGAFATIQKAIDVAAMIDFNGFTVTIQLADGTYTAGATCKANVGQALTSSLIVKGNNSTPSSVVVNPSGAAFAIEGCALRLQDMKLGSTGGGPIFVGAGGRLEFQNLVFDSAVSQHILVLRGGYCLVTGNYSIAGGGQRHINCSLQGAFECSGKTITLTGTPDFSVAFVDVSQAHAQIYSNTFSGSATGVRYAVSMCGSIQTFGGGAAALPGNSAGTAATGGQYA